MIDEGLTAFSANVHYSADGIVPTFYHARRADRVLYGGRCVRVGVFTVAAGAAIMMAPSASTAARPDPVAVAAKIDIAADPIGAIAAWRAALVTAPKAGQRRAHVLSNLGTALVAVAKVDEAIPILRESIRSPGVAARDKAHSTTLLGSALTDGSHLDEAEATLKDAVAQWHAIRPDGSAEESDAIHTLSIVYYARGDLDTASRLEQKSFDMSRRVKAPENANLVAMIATMAIVAVQAGKLEAAETYAREAMTIAGRALTEDHPMALLAVNNWLLVLSAQNRRSEAVDGLRRIMAIEEKRYGLDHPGLAVTYNNLAKSLGYLDRLAEAEPYARRAVVIGEKTLAANDELLAAFRNNLAELLIKQGGKDEALAIKRKSLADLGAANPVREMMIRTSLAKNLIGWGDDEAAAEELAVIGKWQAEKLPETHPDRIDIAGCQALLDARRKPSEAAARLAHVVDLTERELFAAADPDRRGSFVADHLARLLEASWLVGDRPSGFRVAQLMALDDAGRAIVAVSARAGAKDGGAATLIRKRQDLLAQRDTLSQAALRAYSKGGADYPAATAEVGRIDAELAAAEAALAQAQPDYAALTRFAALDEATLAKRLRRDQALVMPLPFQGGALTFVVRSTGGAWARSAAGATTLADAATLRASLGLEGAIRGAIADAPMERAPFDRTLAHRIYRDVVPTDLDRPLKGATDWILAPGGAFTKLPFAVLVTKAPRGRDDDPAALRATPWLIRKAALMQVPAITGIGDLAASARPGDRFVGIGAPLLNGKASPGDLRGFYRGGAINRDALAALAPLPHAERELRRMQHALALSTNLLIGADATESAVKAQDLRHVRVLAFATHGLIGGAIDKTSEPGLVLTPPAQPDAVDDGLLTASEIAGLDIDADWVVLSACDTAAGENPSAPALSGLARAFLYAGARSLLVSHWAVRDDVAARLTVETASRAGRGETRPQALRRAMLGLMSDRTVENGADPSVWAPFILLAH
ncbi:MAG: CHAT domain-containing tetratricopeptide repeat protein [Pseudomonadota bacterium]